MKTPTRRSLVFLLGAFVFLLSGTMTLDSRLLGAVDCVGKPYGFPGCPTRSTSSLASSSGGVNTCGNAIVEDAEQCDKGRFNGKTDCSTDCKNLYCGDGVLSKDLGEECEPETQEFYVEDKNGNLTTEIRFVGATQCGWYCQPPQCNDAGTCTGGCKQQYVDQCTETGSTISAPASSAEQSSAATSQASTSAGTTLAVCGNSLVEGEEQCDDGNRNPVDECTNDCKKPLCGDGIIQKAEECDDGNTVNTDACSNSCKLPRCGDAIIQGKEECDDAARNSDALPNACRTNCLHSFCGDGDGSTPRASWQNHSTLQPF
jgi:cysteine-rich repeat protein